MPTITPIADSSVRYWWIFLFRGILFVIVGFLTFRYPLASYLTLSIFFGATMFITGVIELIYALEHRKTKGWGWRLFAAVIDLVLGIILVLNIGISMAVLPFMVSFWFMFRGITMISFSGVVKDSGSTVWLITGGVLLILFALLIMIDPALGVLTIITWTAVGFIIAGTFSAVLAFRLKRTHNGLHERRSEYLVS